MQATIKVAILDDHPSIVDGYLYRLEKASDIEVVGVAQVVQELGPILQRQAVDVLLLDVNVPIARDNDSFYPILHLIPQLLQEYRQLHILVITMHKHRALVQMAKEAGISGYLVKDDTDSLHALASTIRQIAAGVQVYSRAVQPIVDKQPLASPLTYRQTEVISLCAAYPDESTSQLARRLSIEDSTVRNLLSNAYHRLGVNTRAAAIAKAQTLGLITPILPPPNTDPS